MRIATWLAVGLAALATACGGDDPAEEPTAAGETTADGETTAAEETTAADEQPATLDPARVESALAKTLDGTELLGAPVMIFPEGGGTPEEGEVGGGRLSVESVRCPGNVPVERGEQFTCKVEGNQDGSVQLTQLDDSGTRASYRAKFDFERFGVETTIKGKTRLE